MPLDIGLNPPEGFGGGEYGGGPYGGNYYSGPTPVVLVYGTTASDEDLFASSRITSFRFELLGPVTDHSGVTFNEGYLGVLNGVEGGSVSWQSVASIKGGGNIAVTDLHQDVDWLNVRIRIVALLQEAGSSLPATEYSIGVFLPSAPVAEWTDLGRSWDVELLDKCSILDQDIVTDSNGDIITYALPIGYNVIQAVKELIVGVGETAQAIEPGNETLSAPMTWNAGTTRLKIINDLLQTAGYFSLWCDGLGQYRVTKYAPPSQRPPVYEMLAPFSDGPNSVMSPDWTQDRDIYGIPNRVVVIGQGDSENPALVAVAENTDPSSPFSRSSRGRWITEVLTDVEAVDIAELESYAVRRLAESSSVTSSIKLKHIFLPNLPVNSTVLFTNEKAKMTEVLCYLSSTTVNFDPLALCVSEIREAIV